jgi:hypothetical protein
VCVCVAVCMSGLDGVAAQEDWANRRTVAKVKKWVADDVKVRHCHC